MKDTGYLTLFGKFRGYKQDRIAGKLIHQKFIYLIFFSKSGHESDCSLTYLPKNYVERSFFLQIELKLNQMCTVEQFEVVPKMHFIMKFLSHDHHFLRLL